jgi:hypothetical protein
LLSSGVEVTNTVQMVWEICPTVVSGQYVESVYRCLSVIKVIDGVGEFHIELRTNTPVFAAGLVTANAVFATVPVAFLVRFESEL